MKHESIIERIVSGIFGNKIRVRENLYYETVKGNLDFAPDDLPNWRAVLAAIGLSVEPIRINFPAGTALPLPGLTAFQTLYSGFGSIPKFNFRIITGGSAITSTITTNTTSAADGTYTAQALVRNTGVYNSTGCGRSATATFVVSGGLVTSVAIVAGGDSWYIGDTFTCAAVPGAVFSVATNGEVFYQKVMPNSETVGEVTDQLPDSISINIDDDGTGHLQDNLQIIISK